MSLIPRRALWASGREWKLELPATITPTGRRQRLFFATKQEALNFAEEQRIRLKNHGTAGIAALGVAQLTQAAAAFERLRGHEVTLTQVVDDWLTRREAAAASVVFESAMELFAGRTERSPSYLRSLRQTGNRLTSLHGRLLNQITPEDLRNALQGMSASVRNFTIRILGGLFNFGIKRAYCSDNPVRKLDLARVDRGEIEIYEPDQAAAIFSAAEKHDPELLSFLALSFFCGLRRAEALRLDWAGVDLAEAVVKLPGRITKTRQARYIDLSPNAIDWLRPHNRSAGPLIPFSPNVLRKRLSVLQQVHQVPTIKHGPRHSFASYWLAQHGDIDRLCRFLGHDDPSTTFKCYAKAATKRNAERYWQIMPDLGQVRNIVPMTARRNQ